MQKQLPIVYSPIDESGFSFHIRQHVQQTGVKKISMNRMARLWWIARNSPYISVKTKGEYILDEVKLIKRINDLHISEKTLEADIALLRKCGILIDVITSDKFLIRAEYNKRCKRLLMTNH